MDPAAVWTLAADVECHVWTILQGIFLKKKKKETFLENESVEKNNNKMMMIRNPVNIQVDEAQL